MEKSIECYSGNDSGMVSKTILLEDLRQTLVHILCRDLDEDEVLDMKSSIDDFMQNSATHYSPHELISDFDSTEKILDRFITHLETRREMAGQTLH
jgi:predicted transcriptional regulator YheO